MKNLFFLLLAISALGCVKNASLTVTKNYPERSVPCALDVFIDNADIKRPFETIAIIDTKTGKSAFEKKRLDKVIDLARPLACKAGADGILLLIAGRTNGAGALDVGGSSNGIFKAIKYTDGGPTPDTIVKQKPLTQIEKFNEQQKIRDQQKRERKEASKMNKK